MINNIIDNDINEFNNNNKKKIVIYTNIPQQLIDKLNKYFNLVIYNQITKDNYNSLINELEYAHGIIGRGVKITKSILKNTKCLQVISAMSSGVDNYDIGELNNMKIPLMYTPNTSNDSVADLAICLMLNVSRKIKHSIDRVLKGEWENKIDYNHWYGIDVHHKKIGIVGMGRIGLTLSKRAKCGFDMKVYYHSRSRHFDVETLYEAIYCSNIDQLLKECDFVVSLLPLTDETINYFGAKEFSLMKSTSIFINVGRGGTVNERDLIKSLNDGRIAGAGLDVFEFEPLYKSSPLLSIDNLICTPHLGIATLETTNKIAECAVNNTINVLIHGNINNNNCFNFDQLFKS